MPLSPALMRFFLLLCALGMALLAAFFLRERKLTLMQYLGWGLLALLVPLLGPFLVILAAPGVKARRRPFPRARRKRHEGRLADVGEAFWKRLSRSQRGPNP